MSGEARNRRRGPQERQKKRVSFALDAGKYYFEEKKSIFTVVTEHKFYIFGLFVSLLILMFVLWPAPTFSKQVQHWRDSGYIFKFKQHDIFYQDIIYPPIKFVPVLLILHGYPTSSYDWKHLVSDFHEHFPRVIIPDFLGLGFSDKPIGYNYSMMEQTTMVEELLEYLNISDVHILAHDYGDTIAQEILARHNDPTYNLRMRVKSVCLSNGGIIYSEIQLRPIQVALLTPGVKNVLSFLANQILFNMRFSTIFGPNTQPSRNLLYELWSIILHKDGHVALGDVINYLSERQRNADRWISALQNTSIPLHLIYGPMDPINSPDGFFESYKKNFNQSSYTILPNIGHYPQLEDPSGFVKGYNDFLRRVRDLYEHL